ncbi:MAG: hypothetical protein KJO98_08015, partial [Rhodothermia bacterium]|nr:hypothetical protein [Rhodothermia bacterium]
MKTRALVSAMLVFGLLPIGAHAQVSPLQKRLRDQPTHNTNLMSAIAAVQNASRFAVDTIGRSYWDGSRWTVESETRNSFADNRRTESV